MDASLNVDTAPTDSLTSDLAEAHESDVLLITRIRQGDRQALDTLYDRYGSKVYGAAIAAIPDSAAAEAVVQQVFQSLWCSTRGTHRSDTVWLWLSAMTRLRAAQHPRPMYSNPTRVE